MPVCHSDSPITLDVLVRQEGLDNSHTVQLIIKESEVQAMALHGNLASLTPTVTLNEGTNTLLLQMLDAGGNVIARARQTIVSQVNVLAPFALVSSLPEASSEHQSSTDPITLNFNWNDIDLNTVTVRLTQSVHGKCFDLNNQQGAGFTAIPGPVLTNINLDRSPVPSSVVRYQGQRLISIYPSQNLQYGATIYVDAEHEYELLARFSYHVQQLPTCIGGVLTDTLGATLRDVQASLPELGQSTYTSANCYFDFGAGELQRIPITPGATGCLLTRIRLTRH